MKKLLRTVLPTLLLLLITGVIYEALAHAQTTQAPRIGSTNALLPCQFTSAFTPIATTGNVVTLRCEASGALVATLAAGGNLQNVEAASAANAAVAKTIAAVAGQKVHLYSISARCSAGTAQLTVQDGATTIWSSGATQVGTANYDRSWTVPLDATAGNAMTVTLSACGAANTGTLDVQAGQF